LKDQAISKSCWKNDDGTSSQKHETRFEDNLFIPFVKYPQLGNRQALAVQLFNLA